jgi:hypothetical protein
VHTAVSEGHGVCSLASLPLARPLRASSAFRPPQVCRSVQCCRGQGGSVAAGGARALAPAGLRPPSPPAFSIVSTRLLHPRPAPAGRPPPAPPSTRYKQRVRDGDPMAGYVTTSSKAKGGAGRGNKPAKPVYKGPTPAPNRCALSLLL